MVRRSLRWLVVPVLALSLAGCANSHPASTSAPATTAAAAMSKSIPVSIQIPKIGANSSLISLGLATDGTVQLPPVSTPMQASWFNGGPTPGEVGPAVIFGHVDGDHQTGIFYRLHEMAPGDLITVKRQDGSTATFRATHTLEIPKDKFPTDAVYDNTSDPELRLITCGGSFDQTTHNYRDNIIVYAVLAS